MMRVSKRVIFHKRNFTESLLHFEKPSCLAIRPMEDANEVRMCRKEREMLAVRAGFSKAPANS